VPKKEDKGLSFTQFEKSETGFLLFFGFIERYKDGNRSHMKKTSFVKFSKFS
jgi:hypothetical protein